MAPEFAYEPRTINDKSALSDGWHPAYLLAITDEVTPASWKMAEKSPRMWRWHVAVWEVAGLIGRQAPEHQSAPSSQTFSPGGQFQASKAYLWTCELLGRQVAPGERVNLDPLLPLPCRVKIRRNPEKPDYANIVDLEKWPEGQQALTPELRAALATVMEAPTTGHAPQGYGSAPAQPPPASVPANPAMTTWGGGTAQPAAAGSKPNF